MRAEPRHANRQRDTFRRRRAEKMRNRSYERNRGYDHARAVNEARGAVRTPQRHGDRSESQQDPGANKDDHHRHQVAPFSRTPRPPPWLAVLSEINSTPSASTAATSFIRESTWPRITPTLASMRWMVGSDSRAASASLR